jgi:hypothetical protein
LLDQAFKKITSKGCKDWINGILGKKSLDFFESGQRGEGPPASLDDLLSIASINKYSPALTAQQMGISQAERAALANSYDNVGSFGSYFRGVTFGRQIWLVDQAFDVAPAFKSPSDLAGLIVHELFHVAGWDDPSVAGMNEEIQKHCGRMDGVIGN